MGPTPPPELEGVYELRTFVWTTRFLCVAFLFDKRHLLTRVIVLFTVQMPDSPPHPPAPKRKHGELEKQRRGREDTDSPVRKKVASTLENKRQKEKDRRSCKTQPQKKDGETKTLIEKPRRISPVVVCSDASDTTDSDISELDPTDEVVERTQKPPPPSTVSIFTKKTALKPRTFSREEIRKNAKESAVRKKRELAKAARLSAQYDDSDKWASDASDDRLFPSQSTTRSPVAFKVRWVSGRLFLCEAEQTLNSLFGCALWYLL